MSEEKIDVESHDKENFQVERIAFFSDAVFAIAITLLVIEIKIPDLGTQPLTEKAILNGLLVALPKFIGFIISFFVISLYWMAHHRLFKYVQHYNRKLVWTNTIFLLFIVIMPFSTAVYSEYSYAMLLTPLYLYTINICCCGFYSYRLWHIVAHKKYNLSQGISAAIVRYNSVRALLVPSLFVVVCLLSLINSSISYLTPILLPFVSQFIKRHYHKKYPQLVEN